MSALVAESEAGSSGRGQEIVTGEVALTAAGVTRRSRTTDPPTVLVAAIEAGATARRATTAPVIVLVAAFDPENRLRVATEPVTGLDALTAPGAIGTSLRIPA